jgi:hypothetical protein
MPMTDREFSSIFNKRIKVIHETVVVKGAEYTRNNNRLHNFERAAQVKGKLPIEIADDYLTKHLISYYDMIDDMKAGKYIDQKTIDNKITDLMIYFGLVECLVKEHNKNFEE